MGVHPCVFTEIGIPYDMDDKYAYKTGNYSSQIAAMDANHFALEDSKANGFTLWTYVATVLSLPSCNFSVIMLILHRTHTTGATNGMAKICLYTPSTTSLCLLALSHRLILALPWILSHLLTQRHYRTTT